MCGAAVVRPPGTGEGTTRARLDRAYAVDLPGVQPRTPHWRERVKNWQMALTVFLVISETLMRDLYPNSNQSSTRRMHLHDRIRNYYP